MYAPGHRQLHTNPSHPQRWISGLAQNVERRHLVPALQAVHPDTLDAQQPRLEARLPHEKAEDVVRTR
jgi:hypothetical protein